MVSLSGLVNFNMVIFSGGLVGLLVFMYVGFILNEMSLRTSILS